MVGGLVVSASLGGAACGGPEFTFGGDGGASGNGAESGAGPKVLGGAGNSGGTTGAGGIIQTTSGGANGSDGGSGGSFGSGGGSSGRAGTGGGSSGGTSGLGGGSSGAGSGGLGVAGLGIGGLTASGGGSARPFPSTPILDTFNRDNGDVGTSWTGPTSAFVVHDQELRDTTSTGVGILWNTEFGANQEAYATFTGFDGEAREINLLLKAHGTSGCELIEVLYRPNMAQIGVEYCVNGDNWTKLQSMNVTLAPGDQLGARVTAIGDVLVYVNGSLLETLDARAYPNQGRGLIGVSSLDGAGEATWDDFGGGNAAP